MAQFLSLHEAISQNCNISDIKTHELLVIFLSVNHVTNLPDYSIKLMMDKIKSSQLSSNVTNNTINYVKATTAESYHL
jgi:hypothetical protein